MFVGYLEEEGIVVSKIRETTIKQFNLKLHESGYSNHTIARKNSSLRLFLKFLRKEGVMVENPMDDIRQPLLTKRDVTFTPDNFQEMYNSATNIRDKLLMSLAYNDKIKVSDMILVKAENYEKNNGVLYLGNKAKLLSEKTRDILKNEEIFENEFLLVNQHGKKLSESGAYFIIKSYFEKIGKKELRPIDLYKESNRL